MPFRHRVPMAEVEPAPPPSGRLEVLRGDPGRAQHHVRRGAGESVGLVGPNGAGKTTLFNCVCGQLRPEEGDIVFDGRPLVGLPTYKRARMGIGRTYQRVEVFTDMSVRDHLMVAERSAARGGATCGGTSSI